MKRAGAVKPRNLCIILLLYIMCSCTNQNSINNIPILDIEAAVENPAKINMSKYFSKIEYIPLETTANSLIGDVEMAKIYPAPDRVLIMNTRRGGPSTILSYDYRGKALEFKAKNGRAESEFAQGNSIVTNGSNVFLIDANAIKVYDMDGNYIKSIPLENGFSFSNKFALIDDEIIFLKEDKN